MLVLESKRTGSSGTAALTFESATAEVIAEHHPILERSVLFTLASMIAVFVAFISFRQLDRIVVTTGRLVATQGTITVQPLDKAIISRILVANGQIVKKGQLLATCDPTFVQADLVGLQQKVGNLQAQERRMEAEDAKQPFIPKSSAPYELLQQSIQGQRDIQFRSGVSDFDQRIVSAEAQASGYRESVTGYTARLKIATEEEKMYSTLEHQNVTSHLQSITAQDQRTELERMLSTAQNNLDATLHSLASLKEQRRVFIEKWRGDNLSNLVGVKTLLDQANDDLAKAQKNSDLVNLVAPADAVVLKIPDLSQGGVATDAEPLFSLMPLDAPFEVEAQIDAKDSGFVKIGDPVRIKLDAYRFLEHGVAEGVVKTISQDSFTESDTQEAITRQTYMSSNGTTRSPYFEARITVTAVKLHDVPPNTRLTPGMTLQADIIVGQRTIMWYLLGGALRSGAEGMREP
jgi:HlyD family type I secretion membrane fusion protein